MLAERSAVRHHNLFWSFDDEKKSRPCIDVNSIGSPFGDHDIIALLIRQSPVVRLKSPRALMDEIDLVSISVTDEMGHALWRGRQVEAHILTLHCQDCLGRWGRRGDLQDLGAIKGSRL